MEITIFAKKRTTKEGKSFYNYLSTLTKIGGEKQTVSVKFREECGSPKAEECPMNIIFDKHDANLSKHEFIREDTGEAAYGYTLWLSKWAPGGEYVDNSLDDYQ